MTVQALIAIASAIRTINCIEVEQSKIVDPSTNNPTLHIDARTADDQKLSLSIFASSDIDVECGYATCEIKGTDKGRNVSTVLCELREKTRDLVTKGANADFARVT